MRSRAPAILIPFTVAVTAQQPPGSAPPPAQRSQIQPRQPAQPETPVRELVEETAVTRRMPRTGGEAIDCDAGHMMYTGKASLANLKSGLAAFIQ